MFLFRQVLTHLQTHTKLRRLSSILLSLRIVSKSLIPPLLNFNFNLRRPCIQIGKAQFKSTSLSTQPDTCALGFMLFLALCNSLKSYIIMHVSPSSPNGFSNISVTDDDVRNIETCLLNTGCRKGRFTRYDFVAYDKLTTRLRHELLRVNQTYNSLNGPKSCRRPVVSLSYATKSYRVNRP